MGLNELYEIDLMDYISTRVRENLDKLHAMLFLIETN